MGHGPHLMNTPGERPLTNQQSAYHLGRIAPSEDVDKDILEAMRVCLVVDVGLPEAFAAQRARRELDRRIPKNVIRVLADNGINVAGLEVLDLGAGLGAMSEELLLHGAIVTALEPGAAWADLTRRRLERHGRQFRLLNALGEAIPLPDESVDLIVSLRVLEHVRNPAQVLAEAYRVLRPGGRFYLTCENYLSFKEAHYQVPWLPLLPKSIGKQYLRMLGRSPRFLEESVTYTTFPGVISTCRRLGFIRLRDEKTLRNLDTKQTLKWRFMRLISLLFGRRGPLVIDDATRTFKFGVKELLRKPSPS
jgi:SAM-dependent methyltransferase